MCLLLLSTFLLILFFYCFSAFSGFHCQCCNRSSVSSLMRDTELFTSYNRRQLSLSLQHGPASSADAAVSAAVRLIAGGAALCAVAVASIFESSACARRRPPMTPGPPWHWLRPGRCLLARSVLPTLQHLHVSLCFSRVRVSAVVLLFETFYVTLSCCNLFTRRLLHK